MINLFLNSISVLLRTVILEIKRPRGFFVPVPFKVLQKILGSGDLGIREVIQEKNIALHKPVPFKVLQKILGSGDLGIREVIQEKNIALHKDNVTLHFTPIR